MCILQTLTELNLSDNEIEVAGAEDIALALKQNKVRLSLYFSICIIRCRQLPHSALTSVESATKEYDI
jgi:hypothetical protein